MKLILGASLLPFASLRIRKDLSRAIPILKILPLGNSMSTIFEEKNRERIIRLAKYFVGHRLVGVVKAYAHLMEFSHEEVKLAQECGFQSVEINADIWYGLPEIISGEKRDKFRSIVESLSMHLSVHAPVVGINIGHPNPGIMRESTRQVVEAIKMAYDTGAERVIVHPGHIPPEMAKGESFEIVSKLFSVKEFYVARTVESLRKCVEMAEELDVSICLENMEKDSRKICQSPDEIQRILKEVNSRKLNFAFDVGHANTVNIDPSKFIRKLGGEIEHVHLHDNLGKDEHMAIGDGNAKIKDAIAELKNIGYRKTLLIEIFSMDELMKSKKQVEEWVGAGEPNATQCSSFRHRR